MKIDLIIVGDTKKKWVREGEAEYIVRLNRYVKFDRVVVPDVKVTLSQGQQRHKELEGSAILEKLAPSDVLILLDERGKELTSREFANFLQRQFNAGTRRLVFAVGGPFGFSQEIYDRANGKISFSKMTFPHDVIRVVFMEQIYRAFTIINNQPYHHD